jgi:hypothetical protein
VRECNVHESSDITDVNFSICAGAVRIKNYILCTRFHAFARDSKPVWVETEHGWHCTDVARWMHHSQVYNATVPRFTE